MSIERWKSGNPCPVCHGHDGLERGMGARCHGFRGSDGTIFCTREEHAGSLDPCGDNGDLYRHTGGPCSCGERHEAESIAAEDARQIIYSYTDEHGELQFEVVRGPGKRFRQRRPDGRGGYTWNVPSEIRARLYREADLLDASYSGSGFEVVIVEGEKDVERLRELGAMATCNPGGAGKWNTVESRARHLLRDANVIVVPDNDAPGRKHANTVAKSLLGIASRVRVVSLPVANKGDVSDWLDAGGTLQALRTIADETPVFSSPARVMSFADFEQQAAGQNQGWLVDGLVPADGNTLLAGASYCGKTRLALWLAGCVVTGTDFLGRPCRKGNVLLCALEHQKSHWVQQIHAVGNQLGADWNGRLLMSTDLDLSDADGVNEIADVAERNDVDLLVVDCLRAATLGLNESSSDDMAALRPALAALGGEGRRAVLVLHHLTGNGDKPRGSTDLIAQFDSQIIVKRRSAGVRLAGKNHSAADLVVDARIDHGESSMRVSLLGCVGDGAAPKLDESRLEEVFEYIRDHPRASRKEIKCAVRQGTAVLDRSLLALQDAGRIRNAGTRSKYAFVVVGSSGPGSPSKKGGPGQDQLKETSSDFGPPGKVSGAPRTAAEEGCDA